MKKCSNARLSNISDDPYMQPYLAALNARREAAESLEKRLTESKCSLEEFASGHEYFGLHKNDAGWIFREWAPNAAEIHLTGDFSGWQNSEDFRLSRVSDNGIWEITLPADALRHGDLYRLSMAWDGSSEDRIPAYARRVVQDESSKIFNAQVWAPDDPYEWNCDSPIISGAPIIYETHVGMAQEHAGIGTYNDFRTNILPRIAEAGYNTIQLMAVMEHPYYGSFGYHVANFFAASSRFGTPDELKALIDKAHAMGISVIIDLVHSHAVKNEAEGLSRFDGTYYQYFHEGARGNHEAWDSRCFNYGKPEVLHFLLSNCRFWLDEYRIDGFRFDGITSMLYRHHGLGATFDSYEKYFDDSVDEEAVAYLTLANKLIHSIRPDAITIAEDVSGMPGLAAPASDGGCGFDYRLAMGIPDCWFKLAKDTPDESWNMDYLWHELTNRRQDEKTISYAECHDQALVGGKSLIFEMIDADMYTSMHAGHANLAVDRGMALHKMIRLATIAMAGNGYLNFMGNEFGHPEWVDFPREGNNWSYHYARRQWSLRDNKELRYCLLGDFDQFMMNNFDFSEIISRSSPVRLSVNNEDKIIAFKRAELIFVFNFHPDRSYENYELTVMPGKYRLQMNTDEKRFGGHDRLTPEQEYFSIPTKHQSEIRDIIRLYVPSRTAMVLSREA